MIKNITLSADDTFIEKARQKAKREGASLNTKFRQWLKKYIQTRDYAQSYKSLMRSFQHVAPGRKFNREEANER